MLEREGMLYTIPASMHDGESLIALLNVNPQIRFVSLAAVDIYGQDTDEKIPIKELLKDPEKFLKDGVQTDGSSVLLPHIADISNAAVKLIPDTEVNWYVDYNFGNRAEDGVPVGTLRIPSYLIHNDDEKVGSRYILKDTLETFKKELLLLLKQNPYVFNYLGVVSADEIEEIELTSATELEFYVQTPHEVADRERLHTSQEMKEQYWKRTVGPVRTSLEESLWLMDQYGFGAEMGHKEVGGVSAELSQAGGFEHIMEQLEIDWKFSDPMQAADNDRFVRYIVRDVFNSFGLSVTYLAKPVEGVAGSGKHTHIGIVARLKDGRRINLMAPKNPMSEYLSPIGFGAIMGMLKNYEIINPIANCTSDAMNRLKPGYEAPICAVTSLGAAANTPSRNRTVLACLVRDSANPMATRVELRSPNPKSNTYLVIAACLLAALDGIKAAINHHKTPDDLLKSISKSYGDEDFYLEQMRVYRVECNIFDDYTKEERATLFGPSPETVWDNIKSFDLYPEKTAVLYEGGSFAPVDVKSFKTAALSLWKSEVHDRLVPDIRESVRKCCKKLHTEDQSLDGERYFALLTMAEEIARDTMEGPCMLTRLSRAMEDSDYGTAAALQVEILEKTAVLEAVYSEYRKNILW